MGKVEPQLQQNQKASVLVIDDNLDQVRSLAMLLNTMGHRVEYAINATAAVGIATRFKPDVIFLDLLLPDGHGARLCKELRGCPELSATRIFGISASSRMMDLQMAMEAGCDDVLRKPVSADTFERLISGGMSRKQLRDFMYQDRVS